MMEEENPVERIQEDLHHEATHGHHAEGETWTLGVALTSAVLAAVASIASLYSGHAVNHAMTEQLRASDHWAHYQAKSIKAAVLTTQGEVLVALGKPRPVQMDAKLDEYRKEEDELKRDAEELERGSTNEFTLHETYSRAVTLFQVAIAIAAVSVLSRRKRFWWVSLGFGAVGLGFFIQGLVLSGRM